MLLLVLISCASENEPLPPETVSPVWSEPTFVSISGQSLGDGFGSSLALLGQHLLVGAPRTTLGRAYSVLDGNLSLLFEETQSGAGGTSVAWSVNGQALVGSPLANDGSGRLYEEGQLKKQGGNVLGARIQSTTKGLLVSESRGYWLDADFVDLDARVGGLTIWQDTPVAGHPFADWVLSSSPEGSERVQALDEAGYALCAANFDDDPEQELAIGAPGAGLVYVLNPGEDLADAHRFGPQSGRFGHALACSDHLLLVGAPTAGIDLAGAAWCFSGSLSDWTVGSPLQTGDAWQQLGFSVASSPQALAFGGPGTANIHGSVRIATPQRP
jgi:hypothetical protein